MSGDIPNTNDHNYYHFKVIISTEKEIFEDLVIKALNDRFKIVRSGTTTLIQSDKLIHEHWAHLEKYKAPLRI